MRSQRVSIIVGLFLCSFATCEDKQAAITPAEAAKKVKEQVTVKLEVKSAALRNGVCSLNSEEDFRDAKNFTIFIGKDGLKRFQDATVEDPAAHFKGKTVLVKGKVVLNRERPEIVVIDPGQITVVEKK